MDVKKSCFFSFGHGGIVYSRMREFLLTDKQTKFEKFFLL